MQMGSTLKAGMVLLAEWIGTLGLGELRFIDRTELLRAAIGVLNY
jgi:hypothetical protein